MFSGVKARFSALRRILLSGISWLLELLPRLVTREHLHHVERVLLRHQISAKWDQIHRLEGLRERPSSLLCELCGHESELSAFREFRTHCIFGGGEIVRHQCPACDVIFGSNTMMRLSAEALTEEYEWHYLAFDEGDSTEDEIRAFRGLRPESHGRYLNWGAGNWSQSLSRLRHEGWDVLGFEPHSSAMPQNGVVTKLEHIKHLGFDGIFSNNLLEHLRHPVDDLGQMASLLKPGSLMSHATPCFDYRFEFTRFHLFFFLGRSREVLTQRAGLEVVSFEEDGNFMNWVLRKP